MAIEVYEAVLTGNLSGQYCQTVTHWQVNNAGDLHSYDMALDLAESISGASGWADLLMAVTPAGYTATSIRVRRVSAGGGPTAIVLGPSFTDAVGDRTGSIQTFSANPVIVWIPQTNPGKVGKLFICGLSETDADAGAYTAGFITATDAFIAGTLVPFTTLGSGDTYEMVIWRRATSSTSDIIAGRLSPKVGLQKRRSLPV